MRPETRTAVLVSVGLHVLLAALALLLTLPAYEKDDEHERDFRLMQLRTGFPNAVPGDVFRGGGTPQGQEHPPQSVQHNQVVDGGVVENEAQPRVVRSDEQTSHIRDDEDAILPLPAQRDTSGARSATAQAEAYAGDDYLSQLEQRLAQRGESDDVGGMAVEGEVLVYDAQQNVVARGVRKRAIPSYPAGEQLAGVVRVRVDILPDGTVDNARIVQMLAPAFNNASLEAARQWLFDAAPEDAAHYAVLKFRYVLE